MQLCLGTRNIFLLKSANQERKAKFGTRERGNGNLGALKKSFEKACGNVECEEEMKERGHASREGPAGTRAQLCGLLLASAVCRLLHRAPPQASRLLSEVL